MNMELYLHLRRGQSCLMEQPSRQISLYKMNIRQADQWCWYSPQMLVIDPNIGGYSECY